MAVFKQANETLKQQLDALQKQLNSPEAATPSFVAKQRTRLAAAESKAENAGAQAQQLQVENIQLVKQIEVLQTQLSSAGLQPNMLPDTAASSKKPAVLGEDSVVAAAEELLSGRSTSAAAAAGGGTAAQQSSSIQQQEATTVSAEWKLAEIQRLQDDNRLLQAKASPLHRQSVNACFIHCIAVCLVCSYVQDSLPKFTGKGQHNVCSASCTSSASLLSCSLHAAASLATDTGVSCLHCCLHHPCFTTWQVTSLQEQLHDLERLNAQLERQAAKACNLGLAASLESGGRSGASSQLGQQHPLAAAAARWAGASVNSSGPREELTAADLAAARGSGPASPGNDDDEDDEGADERSQQGVKTGVIADSAVAAAAGQAEEPVSIFIRPAAAAADNDGSSSGPSGLVKGLLQRFSSKGKAQQVEQAEAADSAAAGDNTLIPAFRPQEMAASAQASAQQGTGVRHDGAISREAAQQLKALVAAMAEKPAEQLAADHAEAFYDWETPFKLEPEEDAQFGELLPLEMPGRPGLLMAAQHSQQVCMQAWSPSMVHVATEVQTNCSAVSNADKLCAWDVTSAIVLEPVVECTSSIASPPPATSVQHINSTAWCRLQELVANQGRLLASINRQLDEQVASFGIHPGRTGLSNQEVIAAMQMLR
jgi:hypothetical protein